MSSSSQPERPAYCYRFGTVEFDEARFELKVAGLPVEVERRALEVLAQLLRHAGEVVTKAELFEHVWADRITVEKVLPNAIAKLRRALGEANAQYLVTQPRAGYMLDATVERIAVGHRLSSRIELEAGQPVPLRPHFVLRRQLGSTRNNEVWLAEHAKTREPRVYKFAADGERLRDLKREATLSRVLRDGLGERPDLVRIIDWNFEDAPFFLECEYGGQSLPEWAPEALPGVPQSARLEIFLQVAGAVADAHRVGVLHKDLKPANLLIMADGDGWRARVTDFGSGRLLDPDRLDALGITRMGLTLTQNLSSTDGTPFYIAPELLAGQAPSVQSDVFALGVILYQLLAGDLAKPMLPGWERDIADELLREDIGLATDGDPAQRLESVSALAARLRGLDARRQERARQREADELLRATNETLARSRARRPYFVALVAVLAVAVAALSLLTAGLLQARDEARQALDRATALNRFLDEDLISRLNPLVFAKGQDASLRDVLLASRDGIASRFDAAPETEALVRVQLGSLLNNIELMDEAEAELRAALALYEARGLADDIEAVRARSVLVRSLSRRSQFEPAGVELAELERIAAGTEDEEVRFHLASARALFLMGQGRYADALPELEEAERLIVRIRPEYSAQHDAIRLDLIPVMAMLGYTEAAEPKALQLLEDMESRQPRNELGVALARQVLADVLIVEGDLERAESLLLQAQAIIVPIAGPDHLRNLHLVNKLMDIADRRRDWPTALAHAQTLYDAFRDKFGDIHVSTNASLGNWGQMLYKAGDYAAAEARLGQAHRTLAEHYSVDNPQAQGSAFWLAASKLELRKTEEAERLLDGLAEERLRNMFNDETWPYRLAVLRGALQAQQGRPDEARTTLQGAREGLERYDMQDHILYEKSGEFLRAL